MKTYTVADIASLRGVTVESVNHWVRRSGVVPDFKEAHKGTRLYSARKANMILSNSPQYRNQQRKADCVQLYVNGVPVTVIEERLGMARNAVQDIVSAFEVTGEIVLESKLNFTL
jgi:transposase-like protein